MQINGNQYRTKIKKRTRKTQHELRQKLKKKNESYADSMIQIGNVFLKSIS